VKRPRKQGFQRTARAGTRSLRARQLRASRRCLPLRSRQWLLLRPCPVDLRPLRTSRRWPGRPRLPLDRPPRPRRSQCRRPMGSQRRSLALFPRLELRAGLRLRFVRLEPMDRAREQSPAL